MVPSIKISENTPVGSLLTDLHDYIYRLTRPVTPGDFIEVDRVYPILGLHHKTTRYYLQPKTLFKSIQLPAGGFVATGPTKEYVDSQVEGHRSWPMPSPWPGAWPSQPDDTKPHDNECDHVYVNIGFNTIKMACKFCGKDQ
jgi:hypothetical protein